MTVKYEENDKGFFWVDGENKGEPQKDLRGAMDDWTLEQVRRTERVAEEQARARGGEAEEADPQVSSERIAGFTGGSGSTPGPDQESGDPSPEGEDDTEEDG